MGVDREGTGGLCGRAGRGDRRRRAAHTAAAADLIRRAFEFQMWAGVRPVTVVQKSQQWADVGGGEPSAGADSGSEPECARKAVPLQGTDGRRRAEVKPGIAASTSLRKRSATGLQTATLVNGRMNAHSCNVAMLCGCGAVHGMRGGWCFVLHASKVATRSV